MKLIRTDLKKGEVKLQIEYPEDLWYVGSILDAGDTVTSRTLRRIKIERERKAEIIRKPVTLTLEVEKSELAKGVLRITGKIIAGPEDIPRGSYHSFAVETNTILQITKEKWLHFQIDRLEEAAKVKAPNIIIMVMDREDALFARLTRRGYQVLSQLKGEVAKKREGVKGKGDFYQQIIKKLSAYDKRYKLDKIIVASPAFWREELAKVLTNKTLQEKILYASCSSVDEQAINEVIKRPETQTALEQHRFAKESSLVDSVLLEIAKEGKVVYGLKKTKDAAEAGAIITLLVSDKLIADLREKEEYGSLDYIMRMVEQQQGKVMIITHTHAAGKKLDGIGGIAALLRYRL